MHRPPTARWWLCSHRHSLGRHGIPNPFLKTWARGVVLLYSSLPLLPGRRFPKLACNEFKHKCVVGTPDAGNSGCSWSIWSFGTPRPWWAEILHNDEWCSEFKSQFQGLGEEESPGAEAATEAQLLHRHDVFPSPSPSQVSMAGRVRKEWYGLSCRMAWFVFRLEDLPQEQSCPQ